jgi:hypothetical protein
MKVLLKDREYIKVWPKKCQKGEIQPLKIGFAKKQKFNQEKIKVL